MKLRLASVVLMACLTGLCHYHSAAQNNVAAIQYYFNTDPGVGNTGNGGIIAITPTADFNQTIAITVPNTIPNGFNNLYIRAMDESGRWSLNERRVFMIKTMNATADVTAYQYYFDTDPGVGVQETVR